MRVVYSAAHRGHDPLTEIETGATVPPYERPERADAIHHALVADPAFSLEGPTAHGIEPLRAVHDADYLTFLEQAWTDWSTAMPALRQAIPDSFPNPALRDGMGPGRPPTGAVARMSYYGFDTATVVVNYTMQDSQGATCVFVQGFETPMIVQKKDGAFLYATTDLATIQFRLETWRPQTILYVVDHRQSEHFDKLIAVATP